MSLLRRSAAVARILAKGAAAVVVFVLALVFAAVMHLDLPSARRIAVKELNAILAPSFVGTVTIDKVAGLGIFGARGVTVRVLGSDGQQLLYAQGVRAVVAPFRIVRSVLFGKGDMQVDVAMASVDYVDVDLDADDKGDLELSHAFDPKTPSPPPTTPSRGLRLWFPRLTAGHAWVHGTMAGAPPLDMEIDRLTGALLDAPEVTRIDVAGASIVTRALPMEANLVGGVEAHVTLPSAPAADTVIAAIYIGEVGGAPTTASASMAGKRLEAVLDVPEISAAHLRAQMTDVPLYESVSAHAEVHGELTDLHATGLMHVGHGHIDLDGHAFIADDMKASAHIEASDVDVRAFRESGAHSSVGAIVDLQARKPKDGPIAASFAVDVPVGRFAGQVVPHAVFRGNVTDNADSERGPVGVGGHVAGEIDEEGAPVTLVADASPSPSGEQLVFDVRSKIRDLGAARRFGDLGRGRIELEANGKVVLAPQPIVDGAVHAQVAGFARGKSRVDRADVKVLATGNLMNPALKTSVEADGIQIASYRISHVGAAADGLRDNQDVMLLVRGEKDFPTLQARANVETAHGLAVHVANAWVSRNDATVALRVREATVDRGAIVVQGVELDGLGPVAHASFRQSGGKVVVRATAESLDLKRLGYVLRMEDTIKDGHLAFDIDLDARRDGAQGKAKVQAENVSVFSIKDGAADVDAKMDGRKISGGVRLALKDIAFVDVRSDALHIGGKGPLDVGAWRSTWGKVTFSSQGDAGKLANMVSADSLPVSNVSGRFVVKGTLARDSESDDTPEISLSAWTQGLVVGTKSGPVEHRGKMDIISPPRSKVFGVDLQLDVRVDGTTGFAEVAGRLVDKRGAIVGIDAKSVEVPFKELFASFDGAAGRLAKVPLSIMIAVPDRNVEELPPWIHVPGVTGSIGGTVALSGTADDPKVSASLQGRSLRVSGMTKGSRLDAELTVAYDGQKGDLDVHVRSPEREVLAASAHVDAKAAGVLVGDNEMGAWTASAKAKLAEFPLAAVGFLSDREVGGHISGDLSLDDLHKDARAKLALKIDDLSVGTAKYKSGLVAVTLDDKGLDASARLDQDSGFAEVKGKMAMTWGDHIAPEVDPKGTAEATLQAKRFRIAALLPFVQGQLSELDGHVDADARFKVSGGAKPTMDGHVTLSDGLLGVNALGEEFHAVSAKVSLAPGGVVSLTDASLSGPSGKVLASGHAQLDGLSLVSAEATLTIDKKNALPLDVAGSPMGQIYGNVAIKAKSSADQKEMTVAVDIPKLHVDLPLTSMSAVQDLGVPVDEHIGYLIASNRFLLLPLDPTDKPVKKEDEAQESVIDLKVHLGKDVEILRGSTLKVVLDGDPSVRMAKETVVRGQIHLKSGTLTTQGKKFEIEKGTVSFVGTDPGNPEVSVSAGWTAQDGTRVYADFVGPLKTGKVTLRSEPARPNNEIVALILFGTADGSQSTPYATPSEDNATRVGTTAGGFATEGLSKGLDQLTGMEISTKIDTSNSSNPRPEVEMQIAKDISVQLAFVLGTPPPGMNPDTTYASIDWRFVRNWSLETTFGNLGSTMADIIWQYRY